MMADPAVPPLTIGGRPLRLLMVNQYFHPDIAATSQIMTDLAVDLASYGAQVSVVTGRSPYVGDARYPAHDRYEGVEIIRPPGTRLGRSSVPRRVADYATFGVGCTARVLSMAHQDIVVTLSTPPLVSVLGATHKKLRRSKFVYWVQDLYPDAAVAMGVLRQDAPATRALDRVARSALNAADAVVAIGETMAERLVGKGADSKRVHVIHNWSNAEIGDVPKEQNWFLDRHNLRGKFVVLYSGNMGRGHEFDTLIEAANVLRDRKDIVFLFIGEGARRRDVERSAPGLPNIQLLPYQRREDLPFSLGSGDLFAITLTDGLEGLLVPSKLYGALAARRPVLFIGPEKSEVAIAVKRHDCGRVFPHGDGRGVAGFIAKLADDPAEVARMGSRGRSAFETQYDRSIATARFAEICRMVAAPQP